MFDYALTRTDTVDYLIFPAAIAVSTSVLQVINSRRSDKERLHLLEDRVKVLEELVVRE